MKENDFYCRLLIDGQTVFVTKEYAEKYSSYLSRYKELWFESVDLYVKAKSIISTFNDESFDEVKYSKPCKSFNEDVFSTSFENLVIGNMRMAKLCKKIPKSGKNFSTHYFKSSDLILSKKTDENGICSYEVHLKNNNSTTIVSINDNIRCIEDEIIFTDFYKVTEDEKGNLRTIEYYNIMFPYYLISNNDNYSQIEKTFEECSKMFMYQVEQHNYFDGKPDSFSLNEIRSMFDSRRRKNHVWYTITEKNYLFVNDENGKIIGYKAKEGYQTEWDNHIYEIVDNKMAANSKYGDNSYRKVLQYLKRKTKNVNSLDMLIDAFENMCNIPITGEEGKEILYETGTYSFTGKSLFHFSFVRQMPNGEGEYYQIHLDVLYEPTEETKKYQQFIWSFDLEGSIFEYIKNSPEYRALKDIPICETNIYIDET